MSYSVWWEEPFSVIDFETTGTETWDRVVQVGVARFEEGQLVRTWGSLVWSGVEIPKGATEIHGIRTVDVADAPPWAAMIPKLIEITRGSNPVGYNGEYFDKRMFKSEMARVPVDLAGLPRLPLFEPHTRWIDPLVWVRSVDRWVKGDGRHKLVKACERRNIKIGKAHEALSDATATGQLLWDMRHEIGEMTTTELLRQQFLLGEAQERQFAAWKARKARGLR